MKLKTVLLSAIFFTIIGYSQELAIETFGDEVKLFVNSPENQGSSFLLLNSIDLSRPFGDWDTIAEGVVGEDQTEAYTHSLVDGMTEEFYYLLIAEGMNFDELQIEEDLDASEIPDIDYFLESNIELTEVAASGDYIIDLVVWNADGTRFIESGSIELILLDGSQEAIPKTYTISPSNIPVNNGLAEVVVNIQIPGTNSDI